MVNRLMFYLICAIVLFVLGIFGVVANVFTLLAIGGSRNSSGPFYMLLMSLCVSDILSGLISLVMAAGMVQVSFPYNELFQYGELLAYLPSIVTSLHVCIFCILRFVSVQWPRKELSTKLTKCIIGAIWTLSVLGAGIFAIVYVGFEHLYTELSIVSSTVIEVLLLSLIILITFFTTALIISIHLTKKKFSQNPSEEFNVRANIKYKFIILQLTLIVLSFYVGYIPLCVYLDALIYAHKNILRGSYILRIAAYICLRVSECLNPIFYNVASKDLRVESVRLIKVISNCGRNRSEIQQGDQEEYVNLQTLHTTTPTELS